MEEYLPSVTMDSDRALEPDIARKIGATLPKYHAIDMPASRNRRCFQGMRKFLKEYKDLGGGDYDIIPTTVTYSEHPKTVSVEDLGKEIDLMEKWADELFQDTVVFCHNDLCCSNLLEISANNEIVPIDWEFASYNYRGFDLSIHLSENAVDFRDPTPPGIKFSEELTDNHPNVQIFCEGYVDADNKLKNRIPSDRDAEVSRLMEEIQFFWPINHFFWALFVMKLTLQNFNSGSDMDVQAKDRLAIYYHLKPRTQKIWEELRKNKSISC